MHAVLSAALRPRRRLWTDLQAIDLAIWDGYFPEPRITNLFDHGVTCDLRWPPRSATDAVRRILDADVECIRETRPSGRHPLSAAVEAGHDASRGCSWPAALIRLEGADRPEGTVALGRGRCGQSRDSRAVARPRRRSKRRGRLVRQRDLTRRHARDSRIALARGGTPRSLFHSSIDDDGKSTGS